MSGLKHSAYAGPGQEQYPVPFRIHPAGLSGLLGTMVVLRDLYPSQAEFRSEGLLEALDPA